jgi:hypothetical protein
MIEKCREEVGTPKGNSEALRKLTLTSDMIRGRHKAERI